MAERDSDLRAFLYANDLSGVSLANLAGDASNRRYFRLHSPQGKFVLMDAPPSKGEDVRPFVTIASFLRDAKLSAPRVIAEDTEHGFLLLEDLGDDLFARVVENEPALETKLYTAATDVLVKLHCARPPANLSAYDANTASDLAALAFDWYAFGATGDVKPQLRATLIDELSQLISDHANDAEVLVQRDYHSENLLWLPDRAGTDRVGLLDFQDAMRGSRAYDLVSLLQDARRDVSQEIENSMLQHYMSAAGQNSSNFERAYAIWGAQRNLRILGVFARLCMRDGKPGYLKFMKRVWSLLLRDLAHEDLSDLRAIVLGGLPEPTPEILKKIETQCGRHQTQ